MNRFASRTAVVTGAASGIGRAAAHRLAAEGARVFLVDRNAEQLPRTAAELPPASMAGYTAADLKEVDQARGAVARAVEELGGIDVLINNAGDADVMTFLDLDEERWDRIVKNDLRSIFLVGQAAAKHMVERGAGGAIVNTASTSGIVADVIGPCAHYSAAKAGVVSLTAQMAVELARHRVRVNAVCPGAIATPMIPPASTYMQRVFVPLKRRGTPEEIAGVMAFLASDDASYITGEAIVADGGLTIT